MDAALCTSGLTKRFGERTAVDNLTLRVGRGEIYGFLGLNGAGKTTTIRMLLGMVRPSSGAAWIFGSRISPGSRAVWSDVGYLVETPSAYPELSVRENLAVAARLHRLTDQHAVDRILDRLALAAYADRPARTLSLGNLQRLGLAKALLHAPKLLILDEPATGLDPAGVVEVRELLRDLAHRQGVTVFMSSHLLGEVARVATRIAIIHAGRLVEEVDAGELDRRTRRWLVVDARDRQEAQTALNEAGLRVSMAHNGALELTDERAVSHPDEIARLLVQAGTPPTRLSVEQDDLEAYFLQLVGLKNGGGR